MYRLWNNFQDYQNFALQILYMDKYSFYSTTKWDMYMYKLYPDKSLHLLCPILDSYETLIIISMSKCIETAKYKAYKHRFKSQFLIVQTIFQQQI